MFLNKKKILENNQKIGIEAMIFENKNKYMKKNKTKLNIINHELYNKIEFKELMKIIKEEK